MATERKVITIKYKELRQLIVDNYVDAEDSLAGHEVQILLYNSGHSILSEDLDEIVVTIWTKPTHD